MVALTDLQDKVIALLLKGETEDGEKDWAVFTGLGQVVDASLQLYRGEDNPPVAIREAWLERIRPVEPDLKQIMCDADFMIPLTVGNLADDDREGLEPTGLKWPGEDA